MRALRYTSKARGDLADIAQYILEVSGDANVARHFTGQLRDRCRTLSELPGMLGRGRPELGHGLRSVAFKSYVIFFRYSEDAIEIVSVLHGHRDIVASFGDDA